MSTKQVRDLHVGDILLSKTKESRIITDIDHRSVAYLVRTADLAGENSHFDTYDALDEVKVWGTQGVLF